MPQGAKGNSYPFTHGCVETSTQLFDDLAAYRNDHPSESSFAVRVNYTDATTRGDTKQ